MNIYIVIGVIQRWLAVAVINIIEIVFVCVARSLLLLFW